MDCKGHRDASSLLLNAEEDDTLGVLSMENLRVFGETSRNSSINSSRDKINERLKLERAKAMEILQKASHFKRPTHLSMANKKNESSINRTPVLDRTDYVPYRCQKSINITDLESEKTIYLESTVILSSAAKHPTHKISFEPSEMTARSTGFPRAAISAAVLSDSHAKNESICRRSKAHGDTMLTSMVSNGITDPDFSIGNYFGKQSENIWNIVHTKSPIKGRPPVALVDSTVVESDSGNISITRKVDNKTYSTHPVNANRTSMEKKHESKDSGNASDNSYLLSVSAIERALVDIHTEDSDGSVVNRLLLAKKTKSCMNPYRQQLLVDKEKPNIQRVSLGCTIERVAVLNNHEISETVLENKENSVPEVLRTMKYSDTLSFSDSLLNSSEMRKMERSSMGPRSPLSPIEISNRMITVTDEAADFGDLDEHPSTLERDTSRKVRRLKTTRDISPTSTISTLEVSHAEHDRKQKRSRSANRDGREKTSPQGHRHEENSQPKSLSSTRNEQEAMSSPNFSKSSSLLRKATGRSPSPAFFESPISSPRSCLSPHVSSPTWTTHSPQLDSTTNSDRRYLAAGALSSPDCGKFSLPSYGLVTKTASTASLKGRSTSRCSNSILDRTDYVPYRCQKSINITDLESEKTIYLESTVILSSAAKHPTHKISFEPSEMTARSTGFPRAAISAAVLSDSHAKNESICRRSKAHGDTMLTSMVSNGITDPDFSIGNYFGKQSENIWNIVHTKSPIKGRPPVALVDSTVVESDSGNISITRKVDNKTYSTHPVNANRTSMEKKHESKDSGNASDNSYLLSVSAIERALVDIHTEDSDGSVVNRLLLAKKTKSCMNPYRKQLLVDKEKPNIQRVSLGCTIERVAVVNNHEISETVLENKENSVPEVLRTMKYSDTLSFSDSLLNSSEMRKMERSSMGPRSPLSPIEISNPMITVTDEAADFGDLDEHPSTLERDTSRKVRRLKTTRDISPTSTISTLEVSHAEHDRKQKRSRSANRDGREKTSPQGHRHEENLQPKSLSSTRNEQEAMSSPNFSKSSSLLRKATGRSPSPAFFESPISSPRSCLSPHVSSPTWTTHLPQLDSTTNSDRRYLAAGALSSPDCGKFSLPSYGLVTKTASTASLKGRSTSRCSNSSEFSHRDGKVIPLKVTCLQLSWGSIRLRTNVQKSMQIKNTSSKRLVVKVNVAGPGFQIINTKSNLITLQSQECRSVSLNFCPTVIGAAVGVLSFSAPNSHSSQTYLDVRLYGYGGTANLIPQNILKGPIGAPFLTMGELKELSGPIEKTFTIYNKGPLHGFAVIIIDSVGLDMPRLCDCVEVSPNKVFIPPEGTVKIRVTFKPRRDDIKNIIKKISNVLTLANMRIVCGDEPSRQRIRNLIRTMNEVEKSKFSSKSLDRVWASFPNEKTVNDLDTLKEKTEVTLDLISSLRIHEIALTLNHSILDETSDSSLVFPDADETVVFRIFCSTSPSQMLDPVDEEEPTQSGSSESWSVRPNTLQFEPRMRFKVKNDFKQRQFFEISCNYKHLFRFKPAESYVNAGDEVEVEVANQQEKPGILPNEQIEIWVYIQNERISIPVNVDKGYFPWNCR